MKWILISLAVLLVSALACEAPPPPKMTAIEVCQYVNEALPDDYEYTAPVLRYAFSYNALSAQYLGAGTQDEQPLDDELILAVKELSPRQLRLYKEQLRLNLKSLSPENLNAVLERMRCIPGLRDIVVEYGYTYYVVGERIWQVSVKVTEEYQRLYEGQWSLFPRVTPNIYDMQYFLDEATGELTRM